MFTDYEKVFAVDFERAKAARKLVTIRTKKGSQSLF